MLVATVVGSGLMAERLTGDIALQLLCNALATAAMLGVLISLLQPISGAHFNPVVCVVMALRRAMAWREAAAYAAAQLLGGIAGTWLAHAMFNEPVLQMATTVRWGAGQWLAEGVASFGLVAVILMGRRATMPVLVAAYIGAAYWFTASTSFANPAVTIARMLTDSFCWHPAGRWSRVHRGTSSGRTAGDGGRRVAVTAGSTRHDIAGRQSW